MTHKKAKRILKDWSSKKNISNNHYVEVEKHQITVWTKRALVDFMLWTLPA